MKTHHVYVYEIDEVGENEVTDLKIVYSTTSKFVMVVNDKFSIPKTKVKTISFNYKEENESSKLVYSFSGSVYVKKNCA